MCWLTRKKNFKGLLNYKVIRRYDVLTPAEVTNGNLQVAPLFSQHTVAINPTAVVATTNFYLDVGR